MDLFDDESDDTDLDALTPYERAAAFKTMLTSRATGGDADPHDYRRLRDELLRDPRTSAAVPSFLRICRTTGDFWEFIKGEYATYAERRTFLRDALNPVLTILETSERSPLTAVQGDALSSMSEAGVHAAWERMLQRRGTDPEGAITAARTLLESVCKHILDDLGEDYDPNSDLPPLYRATANALNLAPEQHQEQVFKQILGGCSSVVTGLAAVRNKLGDAHGKGRNAVRPSSRHAELAVNLAGTMASFMIGTWEHVRTTGNDAP